MCAKCSVSTQQCTTDNHVGFYRPTTAGVSAGYPELNLSFHVAPLIREQQQSKAQEGEKAAYGLPLSH